LTSETYHLWLNNMKAHLPLGRPNTNLRRRSVALVMLMVGVASGIANAGRKQEKSASDASGKSVEPRATDGTTKDGGTESGAEEPQLSDAERIARLQRAIAEDQKLLDELNTKLKDPLGEYARAEVQFGRLDKDYQDKKTELHKQEEAGDSQAKVTASELADLEPQWNLAKERFDLAIKARKALHEQIVAVEQKLKQNQEAVKKFTEVKPPTPAQNPTQASKQNGEKGPSPTTESATPPSAQGTSPQANPVPEIPTNPAVGLPAGAANVQSTPPATSAAEGNAKPAPPSPQLIKAKEEAGKKASEAAEAAKEAQSVGERVDSLHKNIELERALLINARQRAENAKESQQTAENDLQRRSSEHANQSELDDIRHKIADAKKRFNDAQGEIKERSDRLDRLQSELNDVQAEQHTVKRAAEEKKNVAEEAQKKVENLQNPFATRNLLRWTLDHGPRIFLIILGMVLVVWSVRLLELRITSWIAHHGKARGSLEDENRAKTLVSVFHNAVRVVVLVGGGLMILAEGGVNIIPLMGGAAVLGLAAAFGGQNLLRDYFTGFMILLENQYAVNDVVKIGDVAGQVERITLRLTMLRDLEGNVHFVPNGHIVTVTNMTHGWSRALFEIGIAYKEDVDRVMELLVEMGKELRRDPDYRHMILEQPEMLGVDQFGDSSVVIKFFIKTRPLMQWTVKRELLRRIKKKFDELGIEIPFPHRTVFFRNESDSSRPGQARSSENESLIESNR